MVTVILLVEEADQLISLSALSASTTLVASLISVKDPPSAISWLGILLTTGASLTGLM